MSAAQEGAGRRESAPNNRTSLRFISRIAAIWKGEVSMSTEKMPIDYAMVLADMRARRAALDSAIAHMEVFFSGQVQDVANGPAAVPATGTASAIPGEVPAGAFLGKSIPEAAILYLQIVKRKATSREITEALRRGGMESTSNNFQGIVHACLDRHRKAGGEVVKLDKSTWGLAEWYPAGVRSVAQEKASPRKKAKAKAKGKTKSRKSPNPETPQPSAPAHPITGPQERIETLLRLSKAPLTDESIAKELGFKLKFVQLLLGKLVKSGKAQKTAAGEYACAEPTTMAAAV
jgi:hypothetical protein